MSDPYEVLARLTALRIVPVVEIDDAEAAVPLARALIDAGLPVLEVTLRTPAGVAAVERIATTCPELLVGAGTLLEPTMVAAAAAAGAGFGVSPGFHLPTLDAARHADLPLVPGVLTPTDVLQALDAGLRHLKFFPAGAFGGTAALAALHAPFASTGVRFMPSGGVTAENVDAYLRLRGTFAVGGTWIAPRSDLAHGRWEAIASRARIAVELAAATDAETCT